MSGIYVVLPSGTKVKSKIMALSGHFDLPACSGVLDLVQYTGHDSCSYCDEHGEVVKSGPEGHVMTFPFHDPDTGRAKSRTGQEVVAHSLDGIQKNTRVSNSCCD